MKHDIRLRSFPISLSLSLSLVCVVPFAPIDAYMNLRFYAWINISSSKLCPYLLHILIHGILTMINFRSQEFGEDAATAINELLGLYGYDDDNKRSELSVKFHRNSCKKIANISQKLLESKRQMRSSESESLRSKTNDYSSISSDKDSSRENSKSPLAMNITATEKDGMIFIGQ